MQLIMRVGLVLILTVAVTGTGLAQVQAVQTVPTVQNRIPQQIIVNGQQVDGAYVPSPNGGMQSFSCASPQEFVTPDGASRGWACFDSATGVWLLNALPPAPQPVQQPTVVYQAPPATVVYQQPVPAVVYAAPVAPVVVVRPAYSPSVVIGAGVINAAGRIASAAIYGSSRHYYPRVYYDNRYYGYGNYRVYRGGYRRW